MMDAWTHVDTHNNIICLLFTCPLHYHMLLTILYIYKEALSALQNNKVFTYLCACLISSSLPPGKLLGALPRMLNTHGHCKASIEEC